MEVPTKCGKCGSELWCDRGGLRYWKCGSNQRWTAQGLENRIAESRECLSRQVAQLTQQCQDADLLLGNGWQHVVAIARGGDGEMAVRAALNAQLTKVAGDCLVLREAMVQAIAAWHDGDLSPAESAGKMHGILATAMRECANSAHGRTTKSILDDIVVLLNVLVLRYVGSPGVQVLVTPVQPPEWFFRSLAQLDYIANGVQSAIDNPEDEDVSFAFVIPPPEKEKPNGG